MVEEEMTCGHPYINYCVICNPSQEPDPSVSLAAEPLAWDSQNYEQAPDGSWVPATPIPYHGIQFIKVRRMCGGGTWKYFFQDPSYYLNREKLSHWVPRKTNGAIIFDALGWAIAWRGDWG